MKSFITALLFILSFVTAAEPEIIQAQLTTAIDDRLPVDDLQGLVSVPPSSITKVYFYTQISELNAKQILHRWLYKQEPMAEVVLDIGADNWRTYSSKQIRSDWVGDWQVQVVDGEKVIFEYDFNVSQLPE